MCDSYQKTQALPLSLVFDATQHPHIFLAILLNCFPNILHALAAMGKQIT
jgi:hypothetical protein